MLVPAQLRKNPSTFAEEWNTLSLWDGNQGRWCTNWPAPLGLPNGSSLGGARELEWYIDHTFQPTQAIKPWTVQNGVLTITADLAPPDIQPWINNYKYTSGMLTTHKSFSQLYGYFEMRALMPSAANMWPAFWLMAVDDIWPPEIDIVEMMGQSPTLLNTTVHSGVEGAIVNDATGSSYSGKDCYTNTLTPVADMTTGPHVYGCDWRSDFIRFFFDDKQVFQVLTPSDCHKAMYIIINLAIYGPGFVQPVAPQKLLVDYIRVNKIIK